MAKNEKKEEVKTLNNQKILTDEPVKVSISEAKTQKKSNKSGRWVGIIFLLMLAVFGAAVFDLALTKKYSDEAIANLQASYEAKLGVFNSRIQNLESDVRRLNSAQNGVKGLTAAEVEDRLEQFKQNLSLNIVAAQTDDENKEGSNYQIAVTDGSRASLENQPEELLLASGALIVRGLAENNLSFAYEAEVLQILAIGNIQAQRYVADIQKYATSGIQGKGMLIREFNDFYNGLKKAEQKAEEEIAKEKVQADTSWKDIFWHRLQELVVLRKSNVKKSVVLDMENDEIYGLVNDGKLAEALNKIRVNDKYNELNSPVLNEWVKQVQNYLDFEQAISGLIMNSLANIRLKQFER